MALRFLSRPLLVATLVAAALISGCATNSASNPSNYGQLSKDVKAVDATIERESKRALDQADARLADARIRTHSYNGALLLVGQVPSEELRTKAGNVVQNLRGVNQVHNELTIAGNLPTTQRLTDTWITTNVVSTLATNDRIDSSKIKVTTENANVYLMGSVSHEESDRIVAATSSVGGIQRIVKVFEYID
ncbi:21 kDa hemolysin precursor [Halomonas citrativorans]|uniref:21 kDa hemolysin n=1 Tax=Halomonas citrativorans TaxID=2742612 RepID=A0A1R4I255_9GAMM|nr:BON domain-containing protein [Halomonas citrativorans]MBE0402065.1 BON domain-containing protein [Halomonas citrativorans]SJN13819.1 21 kDa hemolysin precursor [Halomonas citrativorans]